MLKDSHESRAMSAGDDQVRLVALEVTGRTPLLQHCFSQSKSEKPRDQIEAATLRNVDGAVCVSPGAFKQAMLAVAKRSGGFKKPELRMHFRVEGFSIPVTYDAMVPRMDMVRRAGLHFPPDVTYRPSFEGWKARLVVQFDNTLTAQTIIDLLNLAGEGGIGAWRPEHGGTFGEFEVSRRIDDPVEIAEVRAACAVALVELELPAGMKIEAGRLVGVREKQLNFRLSEEEASRLQALCAANGIGASAVVRMLIKREYDREESARVTSGLCG
jgi:hypothetical protein